MKIRVLLKFSIILIFAASFSSCSFNGSFYYTHSKYREIQNIDYQDVFLYNKDSIKLHAAYMEPVGKSKGSVLLIHGNGGNVSGWIHSIKPLTDAGYRTLVFDYQGFGKSEGSPTHKNVVSDAELFLNYLIDQKANADEKLIVWGISLGGNLSVNIANRNPKKVNVLIDEAGFSSHKDIAKEMMPWILKPFAHMLVKNPYSSKKIVSNLKIPVLIIHSSEDKVVPFKMGKEVYKNANNPKKFWSIKGKHCYAIVDYEEAFIHKLDSLVNTLEKNVSGQNNHLRKASSFFGIVSKQGVTTYQYGSHTLKTKDTFYSLRSKAVNLDDYVGKNVRIIGEKIAGYPISGGPDFILVLRIEILKE